MKRMCEDWPGLAHPELRPINGAPSYARVTSDGEVYTILHCGKLRRRKPYVRADGYLSIPFTKHRKSSHMLLHQMVCMAFYGPRPDGHEVRHLDGNKANNSARNLAWGTRLENMADRKLHGLDYSGEGHPQSILSDIERKEIVSEFVAGKRRSHIAKDRGVSEGAVANTLKWGFSRGLCSTTKSKRRSPRWDPVTKRFGRGEQRSDLARQAGLATE